jgi:hypothetical protein
LARAFIIKADSPNLTGEDRQKCDEKSWGEETNLCVSRYRQISVSVRNRVTAVLVHALGFQRFRKGCLQPKYFYQEQVWPDFDCPTGVCEPTPFDFGSYLAGLIEGDGSIFVPDLDSEKNQSARIKVVFNIKDEPLAKKLQALLGYGRFEYPKASNCVVLYIGNYPGLLKLVTLINGKFRTPKLEALHRLIDFLNAKKAQAKSSETSEFYRYQRNLGDTSELVKYGLDLSPLFHNAWLAGFTDADGNFNVIINHRKNKNSIRVQTQFRLEIRQEYHRKKLSSGYGTSYFDIISIIACAFNTNVYSRARVLKESFSYVYYIVVASNYSKQLLRNYLKNFPLMSSKYNDYLTWCKIMDCAKSPPLSTQIISECRLLKSKMNNSRKSFNWDHHKFFNTIKVNCREKT